MRSASSTCSGPCSNPLRQSFAAQKFHHEIGPRRTRPHVEDGDDGRVVQLRDRLRLLLDPLLGDGVLRAPRFQGLQRDRPSQLRVECLVHRPEPAPANLAPDLVAPYDGPGLERLPPGRRKVVLGRLGEFEQESRDRPRLDGPRPVARTTVPGAFLVRHGRSPWNADATRAASTFSNEATASGRGDAGIG